MVFTETTRQSEQNLIPPALESNQAQNLDFNFEIQNMIFLEKTVFRKFALTLMQIAANA